MEKVGLLAGVGNLPVEFVRAAKQTGHKVIVIAVVDEPAPELASEADVYYTINVAKLDKVIRTMAHQIIEGADGILFFPLDLPYFTNRILNIVKPKIILLVETEIWPNFLRIAERKHIPVMMMNGRISQRSAIRYRMISFFTKRVLSSIRIFCMVIWEW